MPDSQADSPKPLEVRSARYLSRRPSYGHGKSAVDESFKRYLAAIADEPDPPSATPT